MKENTLFKLDLLQAYYLQKPARFGVTKQMMRSEKYQSNSKSKNKVKNKHKLLQLTRNEAFEMIKKLQFESFEKKFYFIESALIRTMVKILKKEKQKLSDKDNEEIIKLIDELISKDSKLLETNVKHKIYKSLIKFFPDKMNLKDNKFECIPESSIEYIKHMKDNSPYKTNRNDLNNLLSKVYGDKSVIEVIESIKGLEIVWGPKRHDKNNQDKDDEGEVDDIEEQDDDASESDSNNESDSDDEEVKIDNDEDYEKLYDGYKDYIAASSDEEEDNDGLELDPNINYNEITDEEPSDEEDSSDNDDLESEEKPTEKSKRSIEDDDFFAKEQPKTKKTKIQLPNLATGYYSGGESDVEDDDLVNEITTPRKNRRGQRARQKIWEKKYGKGAKHVIKEKERSKSDRERLRLEYEARKTKREEKAKLREVKEAKRAEKKEKQQEKEQALHPSWAAKLKAQENLKAKFSGKKITFD